MQFSRNATIRPKSLRIVNGRLNKGEYTYISENGASAIDYLLSKSDNFRFITNFCISDFNIWSEHSVLSFSLHTNINHCNLNNDPPQLTFKWDSENRDLFRSGLISILSRLNNITGTLDTRDRNSVDNAVTDFTRAIRDIADLLFCRTIYQSDNLSNISFTDTHIPKNKERFDDECLISKTSYMDALHDFNIYESEFTRLKLCTKKKEYKTLLKKKRKQYDNKLIKKTENLRFSKPKQFWRFFKTRKNLFWVMIYRLEILKTIFQSSVMIY